MAKFSLTILILLVKGPMLLQGRMTLFFVENRKVFRLDEGSDRALEIQIPPEKLGQPHALDWDSKEQLLYRTDVQQRRLLRSAVDGSQNSVLLQFNLNAKVFCLAVDEFLRLVFFVDQKNSFVAMVTMDGGYQRTVVARGLDRPTAIGLDKSRGMVFYTDVGTERPRIASVNYDGSQHRALVTSDLDSPVALAVDSAEGILYWCDMVLGRIESFDYQGKQGRQLLLHNARMRFIGLDVFGENLYFTADNYGWIRRMSKDGGNVTDVDVYYPLKSLAGIKAVDLSMTNSQSSGLDGCGCSHICVSGGGQSWRCLCPDGLSLSADSKTCVLEEDLDRFILLADRDLGKVFRMDLDTGNYFALPIPTSKPVAIDYDSQEERVFYADEDLNIIGSARLDGSDNRVVWEFNDFAIPSALEIDVTARLLFYADRGNDVIGSMHLNGTGHREILTSQLDKPQALALDTKERVVFYTDNGKQARLGRMSYDGRQHRALVTLKASSPHGLVLDQHAKRLYWVDTALNHIVSVKTDGGDSQALAMAIGPRLMALELHRGFLYVTDLKTNGLRKIEQDSLFGWSGSFSDVGPQDFLALMDLHVVDKTPQPSSGQTTDRNKHSYIPDSEKTKETACPTGHTRSSHSGTCVKEPTWERFLLFADKDVGQLYRMDLDTQQYEELPISVSSPTAIAYDVIQRRVYWSDVSKKVIGSARLDGSDVKVIQTEFKGSEVNGLAVDSQAKVLFYSDSANTAIVSMPLDKKKVVDIFILHHGSPRDIALDTQDRIIYFTVWKAKPMISSMKYDGKDESPLVTSSLGQPSGLVLDTKGRRLYWCDGELDKIESILTDGSDRRLLLRSPGTHFSAMDLYRDHLYFSDWESESLQRIRTDGTGEGDFGASDFGYISGLVVVDHSRGRVTRDSILDRFVLLGGKDQGRLFRMDLGTGSYVVLPINVTRPVAIDYDVIEGRVYWSDVTQRVIASARLDGSGFTVIRQLNDIARPDGLELDAKARLLFYSDTGNDVIGSISMDDFTHREVFTANLEEPRALALDIEKRLVYYTDWGSKPRIGRFTYEGQQHKVLVSTGLILPNGLTLDRTEERLYWCDAGTKQIESIKTDGTNRRLLIRMRGSHFFGIDLYSGYLYYTDWEARNLSKIRTDGSGRGVVGPSDFLGLCDLHVVDKQQALQAIGSAGGK